MKTQSDSETKLATHLSSSVEVNHTATSTQRPISSPPETNPAPAVSPRRRLSPTSQSLASDDVLILQKRHTHLLNQLSAARASLETSNQALKIETSDRDAELEVLTVKWRSASRAAAEEVFAGARDRVNKMGGVGAMRNREKQKTEVAWGWDDAPKKESSDDDVGNEENGDNPWIGEDGGEGQDDREEGARKVEIYGDDDEGYTMDMMLRTLNIELDLIGFDKGLQKWVD